MSYFRIAEYIKHKKNLFLWNGSDLHGPPIHSDLNSTPDFGFFRIDPILISLLT